MASITIRNLDEETKRRLKQQAARHNRSMEEEARQLLRKAVVEMREPSIAAAIAAIVDPIGGVELDLPPRAREREPPTFDDFPDDEP
ncbi:FitA-like ribbon-helix-helix domain-containing protein [Xanthobacter tagetidis]|uniref:Plasmid stabilization protein n=1 Tax=Xanthobacter tagetidis TaxID=60216 RepID=A0A3L7APY1_9HYPH|nr:plasmid stabilization protein [Xanthobacter tagetidis]MBB6308010.1 plasmid stability protein [Xanthobacter tagetidis]RLP81650.1 plasmid stabilization protein [Xanthobacter tagetidis]